MDFFLIPYLIILVICVVVTVFIAGFNRKHMGRGDMENFIFQGLFFGITWPIFLIGLIITAPLYGIYRLGKFLGSRQ